ncbi:methyl-accepting chemotaxis protein [Calothrix sp. PCC 6303]|uniref:methyl-accepting chemotaxis protein n=1 Tax=Calothrix sp. PCC 6303 TaxID=1170562 RepID=UPI0002A04CF0|nr:methyl-accepting chemotaxis protein [Calothrix sp. PCC 6303]AFZ04361.1 methyl-accepting chemotaxis sensory transducer with GAF sensor [Calothrix sp. PCC 6303]
MSHKTDAAKSRDIQSRSASTPEVIAGINKIDNKNSIILSSDQSITPQPYNPPMNPILSRFQELSLRTKATVIAIAIGTFPVLALGTVSNLLISESIKNKIFQVQQIEASGLGDQINQFMKERYKDIKILASSAILTDKSFRETSTPQQKVQILDQLIDGSNQIYDSVTILGLDGQVVAQSKGEEAIGSFSDRKYFQTAKQIDRPLITQPEASKSSKKLSIYALAPVKDVATNETIYIVRARIPIKSLENVVKAYSANYGEFYISDSTGKFFLASNQENVGHEAKTDFPGLSQQQASKSEGTFITTTKPDNQEKLVSFTSRKIEGLTDLDLKWQVIFAVDKATALAPKTQLFWLTALGTIVAALAAAGIAYILAKRATQPILNATNIVAGLGKGDFSNRLEVNRQDELGTLGTNINNMAEELQTLLRKQELDVERAKYLAEITLRIRRTLKSDEIFNTGVREIRQALQTDRVVIYKFNQETWEGTVVAESLTASFPKMTGVEIYDPCFREKHLETYKNGRIRVINNIYDDPNLANANCYIKMLEKFEVKANLIAPIVRQENLVGLLIAHHCDSPRIWQKNEIELFQQLAIQIGYALEQAQLMEELDQGRQVAELSTKDERYQKEALQTQLLELLTEVEGAASGDLTVRADVTAGEIGTVADFFNSIVESLRDIVTQVKETATKVNSAISSNSGEINHLAEEALNQAAEINHTLDAVDNMTISMKNVAENAQQAAEVANAARTTANKSGHAMDLTVQNILNLRETVGETAKKVKRLGESTQQISHVVALINQISMQTNLLAINAGIEAARAGEEGQGFAIVAEEVGELAARSASATKEIEQIVENIQRETTEVVQAMEMGTTQVVEGTRIVEDAKLSLGQILEISGQIDALVQLISNTTASQVETSQAVSQLMRQIAITSQRTSDSSRQVSRSLQQTVEISQQLQTTVGTFKVN